MPLSPTHSSIQLPLPTTGTGGSHVVRHTTQQPLHRLPGSSLRAWLVCAAIVCAAALSGQSCSSSVANSEESLERSVFSFNQHMRWKRYEKALAFVQSEDKVALQKQFESSEDTLNIEDLEVKETKHNSDVKAEVVLSTRYYALPSVSVQKAKWVQQWERRDGEWWMVSDARGPYFGAAASQPAATVVRETVGMENAASSTKQP